MGKVKIPVTTTDLVMVEIGDNRWLEDDAKCQAVIDLKRDLYHFMKLEEAWPELVGGSYSQPGYSKDFYTKRNAEKVLRFLREREVGT